MMSGDPAWQACDREVEDCDRLLIFLYLGETFSQQRPSVTVYFILRLFNTASKKKQKKKQVSFIMQYTQQKYYTAKSLQVWLL